MTLDQIPPGGRLRFETAWMFAAGDGAWAELSVRSDGKEDILYREYMNPVPVKEPLRWKEAALDLSPYAGRMAELILKCYNDPGKTTIADWLSWRDIVIESPSTGAGRKLARDPHTAETKLEIRSSKPETISNVPN